MPPRRSHREAAGLNGGETVKVRLERDPEKRVVTPPDDFLQALKATPAVWNRWCALSYTHQREHVDAIVGAKKPETRLRRIEQALRMIGNAAGNVRRDRSPNALPGTRTNRNHPVTTARPWAG
jgi:hypothetical protein